uniref:Protein YIPF n=1 Tax=Panagrolaimus sp. JU765 TaxID=591449 RepID=A0AC34QDT6_9BILA
MQNLAFQDFGDDSPFTNPNNDKRPAQSTKDTSNLITGNINLNEPTTPPADRFPSAANIFSFKYYQQYFDVDQDQVQNRLLRALIPNLKSNFITDHIQPMPDLYGPLWICITFIFSTAICGNLAHYIETHGQERYENDFGLVTGATSLLTSYVIFVPFFLYWILWYRQAAIQYSYLELLCAYGYSMTVFVPVSILYVIHFYWFRWFLMLSGIGISGLMLYNIVWPAIKSDPNKAVAFAIIGGVLLLHTGLALGFKAHYFDSVIPDNHGMVIGGDQLPKPEAVIQPNGQGPVADAQLSPSDKKVVTRALNEGKAEVVADNKGSEAPPPQNDVVNDTKAKLAVPNTNVSPEQSDLNSTTGLTA